MRQKISKRFATLYVFDICMYMGVLVRPPYVRHEKLPIDSALTSLPTSHKQFPVSLYTKLGWSLLFFSNFVFAATYFCHSLTHTYNGKLDLKINKLHRKRTHKHKKGTHTYKQIHRSSTRKYACSIFRQHSLRSRHQKYIMINTTAFWWCF